MAKKDYSKIPIEIIPYDEESSPRNPFDMLTPEERQKEIVEVYARICVRMKQGQSKDTASGDE